MSRRFSALPFLLLITAIVVLAACREDASSRRMLSLDDLCQWVVPEYAINGERVKQEIMAQSEKERGKMYADAYARVYYNKGMGPLVWITRMGLDAQADTLLSLLKTVGNEGLEGTVFHTDTLQHLMRRMHEHDFTGEDVSRVMGRLEYLLTEAYLRYACGQRFGYMQPGRVFNHLLVDAPAPGETHRFTVYRQLYDQGSEEATDSFALHALEEVSNNRLGAFLREIQPTDTLYRQLRTEWKKAREKGDTLRTRLARINMERARWRYPHPTGKRYVWVNLAAQQLTAVNQDSIITMRVCCGNSTHKSPLLHSEIRHVELNPYWVIPQTIVRKEIMPRHVGDSAYFARNNYRAINKETKEEVDPTTLSAADLRSARYTLRQERGRGNSLGRIIFRFPNNFSVYLHDTNNHSAFNYANRAISHGCIRVENPLELAVLFLDDPSPWNIDRIRISIDRPPLTAQGRQYKAAHPEGKPLNSFGFSQPVPVWLDYWTLYPEPNGTLTSHPDPYGYDTVIEKQLNALY